MFSYQQCKDMLSVQTLQQWTNKKQDSDEWNEGDEDTHSSAPVSTSRLRAQQHINSGVNYEQRLLDILNEKKDSTDKHITSFLSLVSALKIGWCEVRYKTGYEHVQGRVKWKS